MSNETDLFEQEMQRQMDEIEREADAAIKELDEQEKYRQECEAQMRAFEDLEEKERFEEETRQIDNLIFEAEYVCISTEMDHDIRRIAEDDLIFEAEKIYLLTELRHLKQELQSQIDDIDKMLDE